MSKRGKNCFLFPFVFLFFLSPSSQTSIRTGCNYVFWCLVYENQVCIGQRRHKYVSGIWNIFNMLAKCWCSAHVFLWWFFNVLKFLKVNNFISVDFQTQVSIWILIISIILLIIMKFSTKIINNKREVQKCNSPQLSVYIRFSKATNWCFSFHFLCSPSYIWNPILVSKNNKAV